jgi:hypothetical protein
LYQPKQNRSGEEVKDDEIKERVPVNVPKGLLGKEDEDGSTEKCENEASAELLHKDGLHA